MAKPYDLVGNLREQQLNAQSFGNAIAGSFKTGHFPLTNVHSADGRIYVGSPVDEKHSVVTGAYRLGTNYETPALKTYDDKGNIKDWTTEVVPGMRHRSDGTWQWTDSSTGNTYFNNGRMIKKGSTTTEPSDLLNIIAKIPQNVEIFLKYGFITGPLDRDTLAENQRTKVQAKQVNIPYNTFALNNLRSLQSRQDWVRSNADYLKSKGWTDAEIAGYKGQGNLNLRLASQIAGAKDWADPEVARGREEGKTLRRLDSDARGLAVSTDVEGKTLAPKVSMIPTSVVRKSVPELNTTFSSHIIDDTPISTATRIAYTDDQLRQLASSPEYIKHVFDYTPDEFNKLMSIKTEAPNPYSLKYSRLDPALDAYGSFRTYLNTHKTGGKINYQKIFK